MSSKKSSPYQGEAGRGSSRGKIFVVSGPSGSGKSTLLNKVQSKREFSENLVKIVTVTTRQPRKGEKNGRDYIFLDKDEFLSRLKNKEFAESEEVFGKYYATPKEALLRTIHQGRDALLCVDVKGARSIKRAFSQETILIFISVADIEKLRQRLCQRSTETKEALKKRLKIARKELSCAKNYDYIVDNDVLPEAVEKLSSIIIAERLKVK